MTASKTAAEPRLRILMGEDIAMGPGKADLERMQAVAQVEREALADFRALLADLADRVDAVRYPFRVDFASSRAHVW